CPCLPSLDRLDLCDPDHLPLSLDRCAAGPWAVAPSPTTQSGKSSSSDRATGRDGSDRHPTAAVRILATGTASYLLAGSSACLLALSASPAELRFTCPLYARGKSTGRITSTTFLKSPAPDAAASPSSQFFTTEPSGASCTVLCASLWLSNGPAALRRSGRA